MSFYITDLVGERVNALEEYAPEPPSAVAQRLGLPVGQLIKLDANENPYGPTQAAQNALSAFRGYHQYPDAVSRDLRAALGDYLAVDPSTIIVGNGSDELIDLILRLFRPGLQGGGIGQVIDCPPTFGMYSLYAAANDMDCIRFERDAAFGLDIEAIATYCEQDPRPKVIYVTSPNNPDGKLLPEEHLLRLLDLPLLVVLDEAYVEFSGGSRVAWVAERQNLIVLRTFSKWAGLAGLRVGYGVFPKVLMPAVWRIKAPYNVNVAAQVAALATLQDVEAAQINIGRITSERDALAERLEGVRFLDVFRGSQANFVLVRVRDIPIAEVRAAMEARGIMLRYYGPGPLQGCIRISVGTPMQDAAVLMALKELGGSLA